MYYDERKNNEETHNQLKAEHGLKDIKIKNLQKEIDMLKQEVKDAKQI